MFITKEVFLELILKFELVFVLFPSTAEIRKTRLSFLAQDLSGKESVGVQQPDEILVKSPGNGATQEQYSLSLQEVYGLLTVENIRHVSSKTISFCL